jgi:site-specific DNA recombinase
MAGALAAKAFGYRTVAGKPGELQIVAEQAEVISRIFKEYIEGRNVRDIAGRLNKDKVAPPNGLRWNASTIQGSAQRGNGILQNEIYIGQIVWNKVSMVKDPTTGKRLSRPNPAAKHKRIAAPHLRIISDETWAAVRAKRRTIVKPTMHRVPRMLSGPSVARCAVAGWALSACIVASRAFSARRIARAVHVRTAEWSTATRSKWQCSTDCARC